MQRAAQTRSFVVCATFSPVPPAAAHSKADSGKIKASRPSDRNARGALLGADLNTISTKPPGSDKA